MWFSTYICILYLTEKYIIWGLSPLQSKNSQLVLFVCLSCLVYSLVRVGNFSCLFHSLVRVGRFFLVEITPVNNFDKKGIFNYKGLDIKLLLIKLLNYIGLDFFYTARFGWNLSFPCSFLRKIQKTSQNPSNILFARHGVASR